jgi:hypothetical protein
VEISVLRSLLERVRSGDTSVDDAMGTLRDLPFEAVGEVGHVDHHRELRAGVPEVVLGEFKTAEQLIELMRSLAGRGAGALATRVSRDKAEAVLMALPEARHHEVARAVVIEPPNQRPAGRGRIAIVTAGTSDEPVAAEAEVTASFLGNEVDRVRDVGVAGVHRLLAHRDRLRAAEVVVVCAGMEGALPSVVGGLVDRPIIAVPTSVGYGVSLGGFAAMLGMLSSCSAGVMVVNIDNGFGAAVAASQINRRRSVP